MTEPKKILIIDDEKLFCELLINRLRFEGFFVEGFVTSLEKGIIEIEECKPDIVLIDLHFSEKTKSDVDYIKDIIKTHQEVSIIVLHNLDYKGNTHVLDVVEGVMKAGCKGFIIKQDCYEDLKNAITKVSLGKIHIASSLQDEITERFFTQSDSKISKELLVLRESVAKYQDIFDNTNVILYKMNKDGIIIDVSNSVNKIVGYSINEIKGESYHKFIHKDDMEHIMSSYIYPVKSSENNVTKVRIIDKNSNTLHMLTANNKLDNESILGILIDNSEQNKIQIKLEHSEKRFRAMIENSTDVIQITDIKGNITYVSSSIERNFGYIENDLIGKNVLDNISPDDRSMFLKGIEKITGSNGKITSVIYRYRHKNGIWCTVESTLKNCLDDPEIMGIMNNFSDITDRQEAEKKLLDVMLKQCTARELECLNLYLEGYDKRDISMMMDVERETVDRYLKRILEKMGKESIEELIEVMKKPYDVYKTK